jgi:polyisoprenoid-binding protein YceI
VLAATMLVACAAPDGGSTTETTAETTPAATPAVANTGPAAPAIEPGTYTVDAVHTAVLFKIRHLGVADYYGRFNGVEGSVVVDGENPAASSVSLTIDANSVDTNNDKRDQHIKSPDFLNAAQFPVITFESNAARLRDDGIYEVDGELSLHGVTKPMTVEVRPIGSGSDPWGGFRAGFHTSFEVKRSDFGMTYMLEGLSDDIEIIVSSEVVRS